MESKLSNRIKRTRPPAARPTVGKVVRSPAFVTLRADKCYPVSYGKELELSLLTADRLITAIEDVDADSEKITFGDQLTEVARLRMPAVSSLGLAMNILQTMASRDMVRVDRIIEALKEWESNPDLIESDDD